ncbi:MAG: RNA polymerase sigma factor [Chloroflexi bacterium]|nr:RNA polymerase sigma factor [Chloroflexota bacterium]
MSDAGQYARCRGCIAVSFYQGLHRASLLRHGQRGFTTWLHRITVNACLNRQRKQRFKLFSFSKQFKARTAKPSPEVQAIENLTLSQTLEELSVKLRAVIVLRYYLDLSYKEIAETLQIPLGTVKSRLAKALDKLGNTLIIAEVHGLKEVAE